MAPPHDPSFPLLQPHRQPLFDLRGFDEAIRSKGVQLVHHRAIPCPGGLDSPTDFRRPHPDHLGCSGGFLFELAGSCMALFTSNSTSQRATEPGIVGASSGYVTFARFYDKSESQRVRVCQYDRLYLPDETVLVEAWERFEHQPGRADRLTYPVAAVVGAVIDRFGKRYLPGDFTVADGNLSWAPGREPPGSADGRGVVCAVRYMYRPYWYVQFMSHDLRLVTQAQLGADGMAQQVVDVYQAAQVQREYFFRSEDRDEAEPQRPRQVDPPGDLPRFGPR